MTYRQFLLSILTPSVLISGLLLAARWRTLSRDGRVAVRSGLIGTAVLVVVAVVYTTPWDSWLIKNAVWSYPPGSVLGTVAAVPIEEYLFMIGQTVLTGCWTLFVLADGRPVADPPARSAVRRLAGAGAWCLVACGGVGWAAVSAHALYLGAIAVWFGPLLAVQSAVGADVLRLRRTGRLAALASTLFLWAADDFAMHLGAWRLGPGHTLGVRVFGLPVEEAFFFLVTNLLLVNSVILVSAPALRGRIAGWANRLSTRGGRPRSGRVLGRTVS